MSKKRKDYTLGVLTSGGDAPGMNACVRAVVRTAMNEGVSVVGVMNGYEGLINGEFKRWKNARDVGGFLRRGGTVLQTQRSKRFREKNGQREAIRNMNEEGIDGLITIGGDGTLAGAHVIAQQGVQVIGVPASIDNDIWGTDMAIGVDTALNTITEAVDKLRDTASSHTRAFLVETMGRASGYLAVQAGIAAGAEIVLCPEFPTSVEEVAATIEDAYRRGKNHAIIIVAEGASLRTTELASKLDAMDIGFKTRVTILGHIQRGGSPTAFDRLLAARLGIRAVEVLLEGQTDFIVGLRGRDITMAPLEDVISNKRPVNMEHFNMVRQLAR
ncbi:MAG: 6-phosphofructokinase [Anaerolineae bacterium]|jgi:6-phosphofructokinase 1|nr:6-phosphofructokinase [Anaerolineae bacterium]MBT7069825.1 6-phosphofructokinase [Anaerolineae bacterium]MBT7324948.1 6-phosphofructokinase [Anaerolineae bacterium]